MIPYSKQSLDADDRVAVAAVLEGDWLTQGPAVSSFEEAVAARCGVPHAVAFSSGTAALHAAAFAAGVGPGDEIVTSAITFAASANCGAYLGARPLFADIEADTWNVSAATLEAAMTPKVKAVIPVHFAGLPAPIEPIRELVGPDVAIIEDAAHALGGNSGEGEVGSCAHAEMAIFSLHPTKAITSAEGGVVTTRDPELAERLAVFRHHGMVRDPERFLHPEGAGDEGPWYHEQQHLGFNYRLSDVHAALGHSQLGKLDAHVAARNAVATRYREGLAGIDGLDLPPQAGEGALHAHHLFVVHLSDGTARRLALYQRLLENEIRTQVHYIPVYRHPYYRSAFGYGPGLCPEAERYYAGCLSLPCYPDLTPAEQDRTIEVVREAMEMAERAGLPASFEIGGRAVGEGHPTYVIAEAGANHNRDLAIARELVDVAAEAGADAVKFQTYSGEALYSTKTPDFEYLAPITEKSPSELLEDIALPREWQVELRDHAAAKGIAFFSSPFDVEAIAELDALGVPAMKIASFEIVDPVLIAAAAATGRPLLISTGMATLEEVEAALRDATAAGATEVGLMQCTSLYPAAPELANLRAMATMRTAFGVPVGLSDHTTGIAVPIAAAALGAVFVEKHFTLDRTMEGPDHPFALEPGELKAMVGGIREAQAALGDGRKDGPGPEEAKEMYRLARRSLIVVGDHPAGTVLSEEMLTRKRPGFGIAPRDLDKVVGRTLRVAVEHDDILTWEML